MATAEQGPRHPRYPNEKPLQSRSIENDQAALKIAQLACDGLAKTRTKAAKRRGSPKIKDGQQGAATQSSSNTNDNSISSPYFTVNESIPQEVVDGDEIDETGTPSLQQESLQLSPELRLPLRSMYDGTGAWPKQNLSGGEEHLSWANVGFPNDESLVVEDIEDSTYIDPEKPSIVQLSQDITSIKTRNSTSIADGGQVESETKNNRTIESFKLHGRSVCKVKVSDSKVSNSSYSTCKTSREIENTITDAMGTQPSVSIVQWVAAHVILAHAGQLGGRSQDYWIKARDLAQQQLHINPHLEREVQQQMEKDTETDPSFTSMLAIVKKCIKNNSSNSYFQAKRDKYGVANGIFYRIKKTDIVMVLDAENEVILFQLSDAFAEFLTKEIEHKAVQAIETYSSLHAVPFPDMTRHGLHYIDWLVDHPEFDFRNPENNPRVAKSGVYHFGARCSLIDPNGTKGPSQTRDLRRAAPNVIDDIHKVKQFMNLRYGTFGACTEMLRHVFGILDPDLLNDYRSVAKEVAKLRYLDKTETRTQDDPFILRALLINLMTNDHRDISDWHHGLAGLVPLGNYEGSDLLVRELGLQIESKSGCLQLLRGRELHHAITEWSGRRFVVVTTAHESVKRWAFRCLGKPVPDNVPALSDCLDMNQEDSVPETHMTLTEVERVPERHMKEFPDYEEYSESIPESEASSIGAAPLPLTSGDSKRKFDSSSDASVEDNVNPMASKRKTKRTKLDSGKESDKGAEEQEHK